MQINNPDLILFDLDGTLVDTVPDLASGIDAMQEELGLPPRGEDLVRVWVGNGVEKLVKRALTGAMDGEPEPGLFARGLQLFLDAYLENTCRYSRFYPGVPEALTCLDGEGYRLGVVTNKRARFTRRVLEQMGILGCFGIVIAGDTLERMKPDPMPLLHAAAHFACAPERGLMVGDSRNDVLAARAAGMQVICVTYGYNLGRDIRESEPDAIMDSFTELPGMIGGRDGSRQLSADQQ